MAQGRWARLHRTALYDGGNGAGVAADIPGASVNSGGTGNTPLVLDITDVGQITLQPDRGLIWTEYPGIPLTLVDYGLTAAAIEQIYGELGDASTRIQRATGTTDANGDVTFTWDQEFAGVPVVALGVQTATAQVHSARLTAVSATGASVHVLRAPQVTVLSINVLGATVNAAGVTVHAIAVGPA